VSSNAAKNLEAEEYHEERQKDTQKGKYLTFSVGKEEYGIEIKFVTEITGMQEITEVPELPKHVKGLINLRGKIIPVIDVRLRFKMPAIDYNDRTCIIIIDICDVVVGLIVDSVDEVTSIGDHEISSPPNEKTGFHNRYIKGIGKIQNHVRLLLDCEKLFTEEEVEALVSI
jgi:purine-binding chemotaxis protein CheW